VADLVWRTPPIEYRADLEAGHCDARTGSVKDGTREEQSTAQARAAARRAIVAQADMRAQTLAPVIAEIRATGVHSYKRIAARLDARGVPTARGGRWAATQVRDIVLRKPASQL
jgi:hypothetical protein